jgi:hypothetical protein
LPNVVGNSVIDVKTITVVPRLALVVLLAACSDPAAHVQLAPLSPCGTVASKTALRVIAYTGNGELRRSVPLDEDSTEIDAFPADTEQLGVEVVGDSGALVAVGKSAPLAFDALEDATRIPIVMAPLDGVCPVGPMTEPRVAPLFARAGDLVLVVGGTGAGGEHLGTAEVYDPATGTFTSVDVPPSLQDAANGLAGGVLSELPGGRVALSGTASHALAIFDPVSREFSAPVLFDHRAFHGAYGVAADKLLVIGGCAEVVGGACSGPTLRTGFVYDLSDVSQRDRGPALDATGSAIDARVLDLGEQQDGARRFVVVGASGETHRFALADDLAEPLAGVGAGATVVDGGAVVGRDALLPPGTSPLALPAAPGTGQLVALEDGNVLLAAASLARYSPTTRAWAAVGASVPGSPSAIRLADGSVLLAGGEPTAEAFVYRPSLVGPATGSLVVVPDGSSEGALTVPDPSRVSGTFTLDGPDDDLSGRALVGGPRMAQGSLSAVVRVMAGGVAVIAQQTAPGHYLAGRLVPGEPARIVAHAAGTDTVLCSGMTVTAGELTQVTLSISGGAASRAGGPTGAPTTKARF